MLIIVGKAYLSPGQAVALIAVQLAAAAVVGVSYLTARPKTHRERLRFKDPYSRPTEPEVPAVDAPYKRPTEPKPLGNLLVQNGVVVGTVIYPEKTEN